MALVSIRAVKDVTIDSASSSKNTRSSRTVHQGETAEVAPELARELFRRGVAVPADMHYSMPVHHHLTT